MVQVNLSLSEIYKCICPECKEKIVELVKDQLQDKAIRESLELPKHLPNKDGK